MLKLKQKKNSVGTVYGLALLKGVSVFRPKEKLEKCIISLSFSRKEKKKFFNFY